MSGSQPIGTPDNPDDMRAALAAVGNYLAATMAATTVVFALSVTLLSGYLGSSDYLLFWFGIGALAVAFWCGVMALGRQIEIFASPKIRTDPYDGPLLRRSVAHLVLIGVALVLLGLFANHHMKVGKASGKENTCLTCASPSPSPDP